MSGATSAVPVSRVIDQALGRAVNRLLVLAALAITTRSAQAAVLAAAPSALARQRGVAVAALMEPQRYRADSPPASCPYHFDSDMPASTFCVYQGVALGGAGDVCATDVVVIWNSLAARGRRRGEPVRASAANREVFLGFVADPELVVRAIADPRQRDRAEIVGYTLGRNEVSQPLAGQMTLRAVHLGSAEVLDMDLREPRSFHPGSCAFASYSGAFLGMIRTPDGATSSIEPFLAPRR